MRFACPLLPVPCLFTVKDVEGSVILVVVEAPEQIE
jgi:hypothetical protein